MSSEGDNVKNVSSETNDKNTTDTEESSQDSQDVKEAKLNKSKDEKPSENSDGDKKPKEEASSGTQEDAKKTKNDAGKESNAETDGKVNDIDGKKKEEKKKPEKDSEEGEGSDKDEDGSEKDDDKEVPLLDQPLEQSGTRERKKVQRFDEEFKGEAKETGKIEIPEGNGTPLGEIARIDASISRFKNDDLRLLHRVIFKTPGKTTLIKKNIKKFNGFDFKKDSEEYTKKIAAVQKFELKQLKSICEMLDLQKTGVKDEIAERIVDFLLEPKDSGKPAGGGRPKRTAAVRANNRGYSSHDDDYSSDERHSTRARRDKGKRPNLKDESSSESDEDFQPSDDSEERPRVTKRQKPKRKKAQSDDEASDPDVSPSSEESDDEPKAKRKRGPPAKVSNSKVKGKATPKAKGRKPAAPESNKKKATPKRGRKKANDSSEEESEPQEDASSSEDEPLVKKAKSPQPPTDDEIKTYVKEILDGANLEEITMKTVCKQVYAHYPDFDLAHKKDFIKSTVKSLIST